MFNLKEIIALSSGLSSQLRAGILASDAVLRMSKIMPEHEQFWRIAGSKVKQGERISAALKGMLPTGLIAAIEAGESSGNLDRVFSQIEKASLMEQQLKSTMMKMVYPAGIMLAGVAIFIFFMVVVIPSLMSALPEKGESIFLDISEFCTYWFVDHFYVPLAIVSSVVFFVIYWFKDENNRELFMSWLGQIPILKEGLSGMYYGVWSIYMSLMSRAGGISVKDSLELSMRVLPFYLQEPIRRAATEIEKKGMADSFDTDKLPLTDPRQEIPFFIGNAFIIGQQTGLLYEQLERVAPEMMDNGKGKIEAFIKTANVFIMILAGFMIISPLIAYYVQLGASMNAINF